jgi:DNA-binding Lrp family transcriptional regulator
MLARNGYINLISNLLEKYRQNSLSVYKNIGKNPIIMDENDGEILHELIADGKVTAKELAKRLGLPMSTVHHRIKQLEKNGVILRYAAVPDWKKAGLGVAAYVSVTVNYDKAPSQEEVAKNIRKLPNVDEVSIITGEADILVKVRAKDIDELNDTLIRRLRTVKGVDKTRTSVVLSEIE